MRKVIALAPAEISPPREQVRSGMGIPAGEDVGRFDTLILEAYAAFENEADAAGVWSLIDAGDVDSMLIAAGISVDDTPVGLLAPEASVLAAFAITLGTSLTDAIRARFESTDFAAGYALDVVASLAADLAAMKCGESLLKDVRGRGTGNDTIAILPYSPGYCGWPVVGQQALFSRLKPSEIGLTLSSSSVMNPLKSVSGVLVGTRPEFHEVENQVPACSTCANRECRERFAGLDTIIGTN